MLKPVETITTSSSENNKRIAKNTAMLYVRMLLTMAVSLYTSRIVLNTLGVEDYGIYNVVGGFITMFAFLNSAMASATQRFLAFEIGRNDKLQLGNVFSMSVNIHFLIAFGILLIAETAGLWFLNTQLTIPPERMIAARWVFHFSVLALMVYMISVPYNAIIIAHERMNIFAWVSIAEVSLKLFIVFMLRWFGFDRLKFYAVLMFGVALVIRLIYGFYCNHAFQESKFKFYWNKPLFKTLVSYAGWNLWGQLSAVMKGQGVNILLNIFFGPVVNAARGIAYQIQGAVYGFVMNFQMAMNPQIIKSYAANELKFMHKLIFRGAKYSFFLLYTLSLPILLETEIILKLWLKIVPDYSIIFTKLVIINVLIESISGPLITAAQASGKIRLYQGVVGGFYLIILPISYLFLKLGFEPQITFIISISVSTISILVRLVILKNLVQIKIKDFLVEVILKTTIISLVSIILPFAITLIMEESFKRLIILVFVASSNVIITVFFLGLSKTERYYFLQAATKIKNVVINKKK